VKATDGRKIYWRIFGQHIAGSYDTERDFELLNQVMGAEEKGQTNHNFYLALLPVTSMMKVKTIQKDVWKDTKIYIYIYPKSTTKSNMVLPAISKDVAGMWTFILCLYNQPNTSTTTRFSPISKLTSTVG
jgi:hypothetical protein